MCVCVVVVVVCVCVCGGGGGVLYRLIRFCSVLLLLCTVAG